MLHCACRRGNSAYVMWRTLTPSTTFPPWAVSDAAGSASSRDGGSDEATTRLIPPQSRTAEELARRLLAGDAPAEHAPDAVVAATERVYGRVSANLSRWFGTDGTNALFARNFTPTVCRRKAIAQTSTHKIRVNKRLPTYSAPDNNRRTRRGTTCEGS